MRIERFTAAGLLIGAMAVLTPGCAARLEGSAQADAPVVFTSDPTLVEVDSGVWVVRDYDYPVYYVNDDYWVIRDGVWYRSSSYDRGWVRVEATVVPTVIVSRDHRAYVHYHGAATAQSRAAPRRGPGEHRGDEHHDDDHHADEHHGDDHHDDHPGAKPEEHRAEEHHDARPEEHHADEHHEGRPEEHHEAAPDPNRGKKRGDNKDKDKKDKKR